MTARKAAAARIRLIMIVFLLLAMALIGRLYYLQIERHSELSERGENQYIHTVQDLYDRGTIYFTTKDGEKIAAATVKSGYVLAVDPQHVEDAGAAYEALKDYINIDKDTFVYRATLPKRVYVEIADQLPKDVADTIDELDLPGVNLYRQRWRYYPGHALAAREIGFVGFSGQGADKQPVGQYGLERYFEDTLSRAKEKQSVDFFAELFTNIDKMVSKDEPTGQGDIVTTIEPTVARMLQNEIEQVQDKYHSELTGGIIINPKTGEIYALDAVPTFDPNDRGDASFDTFSNPLVEGVFEMGSIIKALTIASGLDTGQISPNTTYYDAGRREFDGLTIHNWDNRGRGNVDMQEVLNQSLNTGVAFVMETMGKNKFRDYFLSLGLGKKTGIELPGEIAGQVENLQSPRTIEYATASFGQGIALTPIETVRALSALGNGGVLITPHILASTEYKDGTDQPNVVPAGQRVWSEQTSETITRMLVRVVDEALHYGQESMEHYSIAAKTGTAQLVDPAGGYYDDRYLHSFFGYFPAYDPEFLVFLFTIDPKGVTYASGTLTDSFMDITKFLLNYYDVPPDR